MFDFLFTIKLENGLDGLGVVSDYYIEFFFKNHLLEVNSIKVVKKAISAYYNFASDGVNGSSGCRRNTQDLNAWRALEVANNGLK